MKQQEESEASVFANGLRTEEKSSFLWNSDRRSFYILAVKVPTQVRVLPSLRDWDAETPGEINFKGWAQASEDREEDQFISTGQRKKLQLLIAIICLKEMF